MLSLLPFLPVRLVSHPPGKIPASHQSTLFASAPRLLSMLGKSQLLGRTPTRSSGPLKIPNNSVFPWSLPSVCCCFSPQTSNTCSSLLVPFRKTRFPAVNSPLPTPSYKLAWNWHRAFSCPVKAFTVSPAKARPARV